jgi:hypothetical protein
MTDNDTYSNITEDQSVSSDKRPSSLTVWLVIVVAVSLLERLLTIIFYQPLAYSDTPSYRRLADTVLHGFSQYDGTRTPGYPVFMALLGTDQHVWLAQLLVGFITTLLLFYIGWKLTDHAWFGGMIALAHSLNLSQLLFESNLLTETLTTILIVLTMAGIVIWLRNPKKRNLWLVFSLGLVSTVALLIRPLFIYMPFFLLLFLYLEPRLKLLPSKLVSEENVNLGIAQDKQNHLRWYYATVFLIPVVLLLGGWISFIHARFGDWSLTTMTGYHLIQHTGSFFEYVPDEYAALRDTYIKYRDAHIAQYGTQTNTIWDAIPEMSAVSGYNFYDLSNVLTRISIQLILRHPLLFIKSAITGWWMFWHPSFYWSADALRYPWLANILSITIQIQRALLFLINLIFIFASLFFLMIECLTVLRHKPTNLRLVFAAPYQKAYFWLLLLNIWIASILQTLLDHGDNPRFLVPLQSLVVLWVAIFFFQMRLNKQSSFKPSPHP